MPINMHPAPENNIQRAIESLERERQNLKTQIEGIDRILSNLRNGSGLVSAGEIDRIAPVKPGDYQAMRMTRAFEAYLRARPGVKIPIDRAVEDLRLGGAELGKTEARHRQNLKIAMQNLKWLVEWDEEWNLWLASSANDPRPRARPQKKKKA